MCAERVEFGQAGHCLVPYPGRDLSDGLCPFYGGCNTDERPRHQVTLTKPFDMMTTEVTIGMYQAVTPTVEEQPAWSTTSSHPVVIVTWEEARRFCQVIGGRLNRGRVGVRGARRARRRHLSLGRRNARLRWARGQWRRIRTGRPTARQVLRTERLRSLRHGWKRVGVDRGREFALRPRCRVRSAGAGVWTLADRSRRFVR